MHISDTLDTHIYILDTHTYILEKNTSVMEENTLLFKENTSISKDFKKESNENFSDLKSIASKHDIGWVAWQCFFTTSLKVKFE